MRSRPRRNRRSAGLRELLQEYRPDVGQLVYPLFASAVTRGREPIAALPGQYRLSREALLHEVEAALKAGLHAVALFPVVEEGRKDAVASYSYADDNFYLERIRELKERFPELVLISDVAMDPYSSDGHDGLVQDGVVRNDESLPILARMAVARAPAGVDLIGPSDMMDGRVGYLRDSLDGAGFSEVGILAYTAKYASAFYGPFRDALSSAPKWGDKKSYQMNWGNSREALREANLDAAEGADLLMVKPALCYLDIIAMLAAGQHLPIAAYHVSGEYAMLKAAAAKGWIDEQAAVAEVLTAMRRAGAQVIFTYFAKDFAEAAKE